MPIEYEWKLKADTLDEYVTEDGTIFENVLTVVHYDCFAREEGVEAVGRDYGTVDLPRPTNAETFIDTNLLTKDMVIAWAETLEPGKRAKVEANAAANLEARKAEKRPKLTLL